MATLLTVPRELRDQILGYVIESHQNTAPELDQTFEEMTQPRKILENPRLGSWCKVVLSLPDNPIVNTTSLLLTNHQLHTETLENIDLLHAREYDLDIVILDEVIPLPTWTRVPLLTSSVDKVNVTIRIAGCYDNRKGRLREHDGKSNPGLYTTKYDDYIGFRCGCGAGPAMGWQIYSILERFIKAGPRGEVKTEDEHRHVTAKTIDINIVTPPDVDPASFEVPRSASPHRTQDAETTVLDPRYLAQFVSHDIFGLLAGGDVEWFQYGKILYEHVDRVVVRLDGQDFREYDVAKRLRAVGNLDERYVSQDALKEYKTVTWAKRRERGLQVL
ncbi:hypothetical protein CC86DRAFT_369984 [Ophiobolus disseminans]|uniref:Uncharacterized protein n=1 Tax=Ophiobolus disseminans TaxID=1469910 RepID=A0A6A7A2A8_9PLEO|nr:hypothetical protein CC86DRAFT_369984 [Ophiobolus disseminans]